MFFQEELTQGSIVMVESQPASYKISRETWGWYTNGYEEMNPGGS